MGMDPFGNRFDRTAFNKEIKDKYKDVDHDEFENIHPYLEPGSLKI